MEKQFVTYEIAIALKELVFKEECFSAYRNTDGEESLLGLNKWMNGESYDNHDGFCTAPLWQQVIDWLREKHCILVHPIYNGKYQYRVESSIDTANNGFVVEGNSWNNTREQAILKALELVTNKN